MTIQPTDPQTSQGNIIRRGILRAKLVWRLWRDRRVFWLWKLIPIGGALYVVFPLDFIPDFLPVAGQVDDLGIFLGSLWLFQELCPAEVVQEHWNNLTGAIAGTWREAEQKELPGSKKE
jgi:uncharacterized membrane protein YkvA (DUF1232 family)